jgi:hypothetical protein
MPPDPDGFMADFDTTLVQQVFDIPKRERKTDVRHHRQADDLRAGFDAFERSRFAIPKR